jgi:hypothetical protein
MFKSSTMLGMLGLPLAACGAGPTGPASASADVPAPAATPTPAPGVPPVGVRAKFTLADMAEAALSSAADKTGLARSDLKVASSRSIVWADGSIGCPQPGMSYTMALVPGYQILIEARGEMLDYHATERGQLILCPAGRSVGGIREEAI